MQYFAKFDAEGLPVGFYVDSVHGARMRPLFETVEELDDEGNKIGERFERVGEESNPDCKIPPEAIPISTEHWQEFINNSGRRKWNGSGPVAYDPPPPPVTVEDYSRAIQAHMDATARQRQYDGIQTAITYRGDPNPQFSAEGEALFAWRSAVWTYSTSELAKVTAGERSQPSVEEFMAELPAFQWPVLP